MKPGMWLVSGAVFLGALLAAPAQAAVTVIGAGIARDCFVAVEKAVLPAVKALNICDTALETETMTRKNLAATYVNRGILHLRMGHHARAIADFNSSIRGQPDLYEAYVNRGAALFGLDKFEEALADLNLGVRSENLDARVTAYYDRGLVHERLGDVTSAYYDYKSALELQPDFALAAKQLTRFQVKTVN
jgi:tetratricopeptide (TPR) repeat protein